MGEALLVEPAAPGRSTMLSISAGGSSGGQMSFGENPERIQLVLGSGGTNSLRMSNLQVGSNYYVVAKQDIAPNVDNPWYVLGSFAATAADMITSIYTPSTVPMEFYTLWRGEYSGPQLAIVSPTNGAVVSGDVIVKVSLMDISSVSLYAYVNGQPLSQVSDLLGIDLRTQVGATHSGAAQIVIPEGVLHNGANSISIVALNRGVEVVRDTNTLSLGNVLNFSTTRDIIVVSSNEFAIEANPAMSSPNVGSAQFRMETTQAGEVALDILGPDGTVRKSMSATVSDPNGAIVTFGWDFTETGGASYTNDAYAARYTFTPSGAGLAAAAGKTRWFTNRIDRSPMISGSPLLTWMELNQTPIELAMDSLCDDVFDSLYDLFSWAIPQFYYTPAEIGLNRTHPIKLKFNEATAVDNVRLFHRNMTNVNFDTWVYHGHANQIALGFPTIGGTNAIAASVTADDVSSDLGNSFSTTYPGLVQYKRRLRTVILHGCNTAFNGPTNAAMPFVADWSNATGTPTGVDQTVNRIYKSVFIGFQDTVNPQPVFIEAILDDWPHLTFQDPNVPIVESVAFALDFAWENDTTLIQSFGPRVLGFPWLPYTTIWDRQMATNNFDSIHFFPF